MRLGDDFDWLEVGLGTILRIRGSRGQFAGLMDTLHPLPPHLPIFFGRKRKPPPYNHRPINTELLLYCEN